MALSLLLSNETEKERPLSLGKNKDIRDRGSDATMANVLIVDDATFMRAVLKKIVLQQGHKVVAEAGSGDEAIDKYQQLRPDIVLMDIVMPPGPKAKDGIEALKQIIMADPAARVVMCSSMGQQALIADALKSGAKDFVTKPFRPEKVMEVLSKYGS
jgi:two-component system chemotaxis response regulator CheY